MPLRPRFVWTWAHAALLLVVAGALLNFATDFFFAPGRDATGLVRASMLGDPQDLESDLVEFALSFPPFGPINATAWPFPYNRYALQNSYHSFALELTPPRDEKRWSPAPAHPPGEDWQDHNPEPAAHDPRAVLTTLHVTPLMAFVGLLTKRVILALGPSATVALYILIAAGGLAILCRAVVPDSPSAWLAWACLLVSAPFLHLLARGNEGSLLAGLPLCAYLMLCCAARRPWLAALLLALACNIRPNAILLAPLLACHGWREGWRAAALFAVAGAALLALACTLAAALYPGYGFSVFLAALHAYNRNYVLGAYGSVENNSAYNMFRLAVLMANPRNESHPLLFSAANKIIAVFFSLWLLWAWRLFGRGRLPAIEFAFVAASVYVLASSVLSTYHLVVFAAFPLWYLRDAPSRAWSRLDLVVLFAAALLLMSKAFFYVQRLSPEVFLNPLILMLASWRILTWRGSPRTPCAGT